MGKSVTIDLGDCTGCEGCVEICPEAFGIDEATGKVTVINAEGAPEELMEEAMAICPGQCITWEE